MSISLNVGQQNQASKTAIAHIASLFVQKRQLFGWLVQALESQGLDPESGFPVCLAEVPEQEGRFFTGIWLTNQRRFWAFEAIVSRSTGELLCLERLEDITATTEVNAHVPGIGKSFGYLALQVQHELHGG